MPAIGGDLDVLRHLVLGSDNLAHVVLVLGVERVAPVQHRKEDHAARPYVRPLHGVNLKI